MDTIISHAPSNVNLTRVHLARLANLDGAKFRGKGPGLQSVLDRVTSLGSNFDFDSLMTTGAVGSLNNENNGPDNGGFSHDARGGRGPLPKKTLNDLDASLLKNLNESQQEYNQLVIRQIADRTPPAPTSSPSTGSSTSSTLARRTSSLALRSSP